MAYTPATRVSSVLKNGGLPTVAPSATMREGNKVRLTTTGSSGIDENRRRGHAVVWVSADFDSPRLAEQRVDDIETILKAAGYRVERHPDPESRIVYVWEPNWRSYLDRHGRYINPEASTGVHPHD